MLIDFHEFQNLSLSQFHAISAAAASTVKRFHAISDEATRFATKQHESNCAFGNKLLGARSLDEVVAAHADLLKNAYENFVADAQKLSSLYSELTKEVLNVGVQETARKAPATISTPESSATASATPAPTKKRERIAGNAPSDGEQ